MKRLLVAILALTCASAACSQNPLRIQTMRIQPFSCGSSTTSWIASIIGAGGQPLANNSYSFNLADAVFNRTIITGSNTDWAAFNAELTTTSPHSLMQWRLTDATSRSINGTVTLANFVNTSLGTISQASIDLTPPSCTGGAIRVEVDGAVGPLTFQFFDGITTRSQIVQGSSPFIYTFTDVPAAPANTLYTITILSTADQCARQQPLQFGFPFPALPSTITFTASSTPTSCDLNNGTIAVLNASGGAGSGYRAALDDAATSEPIPVTFTNLSSGEHTITVTDSSLLTCTKQTISVGTSSVRVSSFIDYIVKRYCQHCFTNSN